MGAASIALNVHAMKLRNSSAIFAKITESQDIFTLELDAMIAGRRDMTTWINIETALDSDKT